MNHFNNSIGIDVSKATLDAYDHLKQLSIQVSNSATGFKDLLKWIRKSNAPESSVLLCFEHTGLYSLPLAVFLSAQEVSYVVVSGLEIKRSLGLRRGKSDSADAKAIAQYCFLRRNELKVYNLPSTRLLELKSLLSLREKMVSQRAGYKATKKEMKAYLKVIKPSGLIFDVQAKMIKELNEQIKKVELQLETLIKQDEQLKKIFDLITSIKGVGLIVGATMIAYTNCFTAFSDWRKFACYCGIVPFEHQSGTSLKRKRKVSVFANKRLKTLLSNAAASSIQSNPEMKQYYQRRIQEGKNKMSTQNIIRNKIVARVFAVVQRGTPYVDNFRLAA